MNHKDIQIRDLNRQLNAIYDKSNDNLNQQEQIDCLDRAQIIQKNIIILSFQSQQIQDHLGFQNLNYTYFHKILDQKFKLIFQNIDTFLKIDYGIQSIYKRQRSLSNVSQKSPNKSLNKSPTKSPTKSNVKELKSSQSKVQQPRINLYPNVQSKVKMQLLQNEFTPEKNKIPNNNMIRQKPQKSTENAVVNQKKNIKDLQIDKPVRQNYLIQNKPFEKETIKNTKITSKSPSVQKFPVQQKISPQKPIISRPSRPYIREQSPIKSIKVSPIKPQINKKAEKMNISNLSYENSPNKAKKINKIDKKVINDQVSPKFQQQIYVKEMIQDNKENNQEIQILQSQYYSFEHKEEINFAAQQNLIFDKEEDINFQNKENTQIQYDINQQDLQLPDQIEFIDSYNFSKNLRQKMKNKEKQHFGLRLSMIENSEQQEFDKQLKQQQVKILQDLSLYSLENSGIQNPINQSGQISKNSSELFKGNSGKNVVVKNNKNNFIKLFNNIEIVSVIFQFTGIQPFKVLYRTSIVFQQNPIYQYHLNMDSKDQSFITENEFQIKKLEQDELLRRLMNIFENIYNKSHQYSDEEFQDFIVYQKLDEFSYIKLDEKLEKILIIYFVMIDKLVYLNIDMENLKIELVHQNYFKDIIILQILENFVFSQEVSKNNLYLIKLILQKTPIKELFHLENFTQIQQDRYFQFDLSINNQANKKEIDIKFIAQQLIENLILNQLIDDPDMFQILNDNIIKQSKINETCDEIKLQKIYQQKPRKSKSLRKSRISIKQL